MTFQPAAGFRLPGNSLDLEFSWVPPGAESRFVPAYFWRTEWRTSDPEASGEATPAAMPAGDSADDRSRSTDAAPEQDAVFRGTKGDDRIDFESFDGKIYGLRGNDSIHAGAGNARLFGGKGDDVLWGGDDDDVLSGGSGDDRLYGDDSGGSGAKGDDILRGGEGDDLLAGQRGNDVLMGGLGADDLIGGSGADQFVYAAAAESPLGAGDTITDFKSGIDTLDLTALFPFQGMWLHEASTFSVSGFAGEVIYHDGLLEVDADGDGLADLEITIAGMAEVSLGDFDPNRYVQDTGEIVYGTTGDDVIETYGPNITVYGLEGNDRISVQYQNCVLVGGPGNDEMWGGGNDDMLKGGSGNDLLFGDYWDGSGYFGKDVLRGGKGNDILCGQYDSDILIGGPGDDVFLYSYDDQFDNFWDEAQLIATDTIKGGDRAPAYEGVGVAGGDIVDFSILDAYLIYDVDETWQVNEAFIMDGTTGPGRLWLVDQGNRTVVYGNTDDDPEAELTLIIMDGSNVSAKDYAALDFIL